MEKVTAVVGEHVLCVDCLGRMFAGLSAKLTNRERGRALLTTLSMGLSMDILDGKPYDERLLGRLVKCYGVEELRGILLERGREVEVRSGEGARCEVCGGVFGEMGRHVERVVGEVDDYEFKTFLIGISVPTRVEEREDEIRMKHQLKYAESIRSHLSREIGKLVKERLRGKTFSLEPELTIHFNPFTQKLRVLPRKIKVVGQVTLSDPEGKVFAQLCDQCNGKGCSQCGDTGRMAGESVEYILGKEVLREAGARKWRFGVKKLGNNKVAFTMSVLHPKRRKLETEELKKQVKMKSRGLFDLEKITVSP